MRYEEVSGNASKTFQCSQIILDTPALCDLNDTGKAAHTEMLLVLEHA
jgi:hypothetical protein